MVCTLEVSGAVSVMITPDVGSVGLTGNFVVNPSETTTYTLTATNTAGSTTANVKVTVNTTMQKAIDIVIEEILPEIPEIKSGKPYWCIKLESPLPPGAIILEDSGATAVIAKQRGNPVTKRTFFFCIPTSIYFSISITVF